MSVKQYGVIHEVSLREGYLALSGLQRFCSGCVAGCLNRGGLDVSIGCGWNNRRWFHLVLQVVSASRDTFNFADIGAIRECAIVSGLHNANALQPINRLNGFDI